MSEPVSPTPLDRLMSAIRALIRAEYPQYTYAGLYGYTIQSINSGTGAIDAQPTDTSIPLPGLSNISLSPSLIGDLALATSGTTCLVEFVNADPSRPVVVSIGATNFTGTIDAAQTMNIGLSASTVNLGSAQQPISRIGDTVSVYFPMGTTITIVGVAITPPGAVAATLQFITDPVTNTPLACAGIIQSGSTVAFGDTQGIARVGDMITLYIPPGCFCSGAITPAAGPPVPIVSISIVNGFSALIGTGSPNVVTK